MPDLTPDGLRALEDLARRHGLSSDAAMALLQAVSYGGGTQAQFNHPELGGMGQWSSGGMIMIGDMFNNALKARVANKVWRPRRRAIAAFLALTTLGTVGYFTVGARSGVAFLACCAVIRLGAGYWAVFVTSAAEQFGTNLRATVTTTAPNVVRGALVPMTFANAKARAAWGIVPGGIAVGVGVLALAAGALVLLDETHGRELDFVDDDA